MSCVLFPAVLRTSRSFPVRLLHVLAFGKLTLIGIHLILPVSRCESVRIASTLPTFYPMMHLRSRLPTRCLPSRILRRTFWLWAFHTLTVVNALLLIVLPFSPSNYEPFYRTVLSRQLFPCLPLFLDSPVFPIYPYPHQLHPALKVFIFIYSVFPCPLFLLLYHLFYFISRYSISLPSLSQFYSKYILRVPSSPLLLLASFTSSPHQFTVLLHTINFFPIALPAAVLTNCSHPSIILALALSLYLCVILYCTCYFQQLGKLLCMFGHSILELFPFFVCF